MSNDGRTCPGEINVSWQSIGIHYANKGQLFSLSNNWQLLFLIDKIVGKVLKTQTGWTVATFENKEKKGTLPVGFHQNLIFVFLMKPTWWNVVCLFVFSKFAPSPKSVCLNSAKPFLFIGVKVVHRSCNILMTKKKLPFLPSSYLSAILSMKFRLQ